MEIVLDRFSFRGSIGRGKVTWPVKRKCAKFTSSDNTSNEGARDQRRAFTLSRDSKRYTHCELCLASPYDDEHLVSSIYGHCLRSSPLRAKAATAIVIVIEARGSSSSSSSSSLPSDVLSTSPACTYYSDQWFPRVSIRRPHRNFFFNPRLSTLRLRLGAKKRTRLHSSPLEFRVQIFRFETTYFSAEGGYMYSYSSRSVAL